MRVVKWIGIIVGSLLGIVLLGAGAVYAIAGHRIGKHYEVAGAEVAVPTDSVALARGRTLAITRGCTGCHTADLGGGTFIDVPVVAQLYSANLTAGTGGIAAQYPTTADWERAIRHGVAPDGRALMFMPSHEFYYLSDEDLGALIAYLRSVAPVDRTVGAQKVGPVGRGLFVAGLLPLVPAELVDHTAPRPAAPAPGVTPEYGKYLTVTCTGCHGVTFSGGPIPGAPPEMAIPRNITLDQATGLGGWTLADFDRAVRGGVSKNGYQLAKDMPSTEFSHFTDDEIAAMWAYLQTVPAKAFGGR
jgi:mono/diheme cytochrome c family protein